MIGPGDFAPAEEPRSVDGDTWCCENCGDRRMDEPARTNADGHSFCGDCARPNVGNLSDEERKIADREWTVRS